MALRNLMQWKKRRGLALPLERMRGLIEPMERIFESPWSLMGRRMGGWPKLDIEETPKDIIVTAGMPGMKREDVTVDVTEDALTIRGSHWQTRERRRHGMIGRQQASRSFVRRFTLPAAVKTDEVKASFKDEVLEIRLPRVKEAPVKRIDIE